MFNGGQITTAITVIKALTKRDDMVQKWINELVHFNYRSWIFKNFTSPFKFWYVSFWNNHGNHIIICKNHHFCRNHAFVTHCQDMLIRHRCILTWCVLNPSKVMNIAGGLHLGLLLRSTRLGVSRGPLAELFCGKDGSWDVLPEKYGSM